MEVIEKKGKVTAAEARNLFVELSYKGLKAASRKIDVPVLFKSLGPGKLRQTKHACASFFCLRLASEFAILPCLLIFETSQI